MKLIIGNKNYSSWSMRPWLLLSHHGLPFEEVRIPLDQDDTHTTLAQYTEAGKVPVLQDGDLTVWDSLAICEYISEHYLEGRGWPGSVRARAEARSCSAEMHSGFPEIRGQLPMNCRASQRHVPLGEDLAAEVARMDRIWSRYRGIYAGAGPWLFGEFSIADCMFAPVASRFDTYGINLSETASQYMQCLLSHEKVLEWFEQARVEPETIEMAEVGI
ncbi:glutathione S-transferase family protein [Halomonas campisalis]|uniref:Glutathione S-transferase family protein n=1 Tax=Billgrantia campisalis TaxID=74661 RepID=A0ABS9PAG3_9GAMM|nr:glutathione S-transferase family protein [Halomonas campisalis]MCG6658757.1 glutathione S-transferase family protein [Halomonas campisalis]MDR5864861.1 glutathione S-transferase family protein [Halomonas campisalis]